MEKDESQISDSDNLEGVEENKDPSKSSEKKRNPRRPPGKPKEMI